jgi:integrase/recombinase XerD
MNDKIAAEYEHYLHLCGRAPTTIRARVVVASARLAAWGVEGMTAERIFEWLGTPGWSKWTRATYYAHLKDLCEFLVVSGYLEESPMEDDLIHKPKRPRSLPRPLTEEEVGRLMSSAVGRERDWCLLAVLAGLRVHEIAKLRGEDVSAQGIYVLGKGGVEAMLPIHPDLWTMAQRYPRHGYWFPATRGERGHLKADTITAAITALFGSLGITGSIHRLRHTYCTGLLRKGVHVRQVQRLMRHGSLETTAMYAAVDEDALQAAINLLPSIA